MALSTPSLSSALQDIEDRALADAISGSPWSTKKYCDEKAAALDAQTKTASLSVPGMGLVAPSGGGTVTGTSTTGSLS